MSQRKESYDLAKFIAILLVVLAHMVTYGVVSDRLSVAFHDFAYSFHMPLFAVVSGYFFSSHGSFVSFCSKKARQLLLPIIAWSFISAVFFTRLPNDIGLWIQQGERIHLMAYLRDFWVQICGIGWFLKALFYCFVYAFICIKIHVKFKNIVLIGSIALLYSLSLLGIIPNKAGFMLDGFIFLYPFFACGIIYHSIENRITNKRLLLLISTIIFLFCYFVFWRHEYCWYTTNTSLLETSNFENVSVSIEGPFLLYVIFLRFLTGLSGSLMVISFLDILFEKTGFRNNHVVVWLSRIGQYTLGIYLFQDCLLPLFRDSLINFSELFQFSLCLALGCIIVLTSYLLEKYLRANKTLSLFLWGKL